MRIARKLTTVSPYMRDALMPFVSKEIGVIPNPIPPQIAQRPFNAASTLSMTAPVVVMVANGWDALKNPQAGLHAFAKLRTEISGATLRLFGSGFEQGEVGQRWAQEQGIAEGMEFAGGLPYANLLEEIANADVFLHPSLEESFGMVVAEAMALGVPVVGGKNSGAVPWVVGEGGVLIDVTNADDIAHALHSVLTDAGKWQRLRAAAYQSSQSRFTPRVVADAYEDVYRQALEGISQ
jgi:glycosyltransferase involved in cell wall biosynthesis